MAAAVPATDMEVVEQPNWTIKSDAFAPPPTRRLVRGWDRAPVVARAPRLQGQKVWKKVSVKSAPVEDGHNEAQEELLKEGGGARKRARAMGARENISNAVWADDGQHATTKDILTLFDHDENGLKSQNIINTTSRSSTLRTRPSTHPEVDYVPRKRTHADHVITPKRFTRKSAINKNAQKQPLAEITNITPVHNSRARKSLRKNSLNFIEKINDDRKLHSQSQLPVVVQQPRDVESDALAVESNEYTPAATPSRRCLRRSTTAKRRSAASVSLIGEDDNRRLGKQSQQSVEEPTALTVEISTSSVSQVLTKSTVHNEVGYSHHEDVSHVTSATIDLTFNINSEINTSTHSSEHNEPNVKGQTLDDKVVSSKKDTAVENIIPREAPGELVPEEQICEVQASEEHNSEVQTSEEQAPAEKSHEGTSAEYLIITSASAKEEMAEIKEEVVAADATPENAVAEEEARGVIISIDIPAKSAVADEPAAKEKVATEKVNKIVNEEKIIEQTTTENKPNFLENVEIGAPTPVVIISNASEQSDASVVLADITESIFADDYIEPLQPPVSLAEQQSSANAERQTCPDEDATSYCSMPTVSEHDLEPESASTEASLCVDCTVNSNAGPDTSIYNELPPGHDDTTAPTEVISVTAPVLACDHDDTDMLRNFLTRVKANKVAKNPPKRKRSLPHSPLQIPLGNLESNVSPSPQKPSGDSDTTQTSPSKRRKKNGPLTQTEDPREPQSCRRSARTRIPPKDAPIALSFIPVRRLGQEQDNTVNLRRNEEKELAAVTRVNTRKNKGVALPAPQVLAMKAEEKDNPAMRQRLLKEVFDEKMDKSRLGKDKKGRDKKAVTWAEELTQFQTLGKGKEREEEVMEEMEKETEKKGSSGEEKKRAVRMGVRSKAALGMALNGTPVSKRKMRGRG